MRFDCAFVKENKNILMILPVVIFAVFRRYNSTSSAGEVLDPNLCKILWYYSLGCVPVFSDKSIINKKVPRER